MYVNVKLVSLVHGALPMVVVTEWLQRPANLLVLDRLFAKQRCRTNVAAEEGDAAAMVQASRWRARSRKQPFSPGCGPHRALLHKQRRRG